MKSSRLFWTLIIPLMLTGCIEINITAGSGIQADGGRPPKCGKNGSGNCLCAPDCACPSGSLPCAPGTPP
jgi:hypothetical protein